MTGQVDVAGASPSLRSVRRWQRFFRLEFAASPPWQWLRGRLSRPPPDGELPLGLLCSAQALGHTEPTATIGETINWLAQAGLGCRVAQFDGSITIRRVWHC